jgi:hypothetical protein
MEQVNSQEPRINFPNYTKDVVAVMFRIEQLLVDLDAFYYIDSDDCVCYLNDKDYSTLFSFDHPLVTGVIVAIAGNRSIDLLKSEKEFSYIQHKTTGKIYEMNGTKLDN